MYSRSLVDDIIKMTVQEVSLLKLVLSEALSVKIHPLHKLSVDLLNEKQERDREQQCEYKALTINSMCVCVCIHTSAYFAGMSAFSMP